MTTKGKTKRTFACALALTLGVGPLLATAVEAAGNRRNANGQIMRLGGPDGTSARRNRAGIMRLGGPTNGVSASPGIGGFNFNHTTGTERRGTCQFCSTDLTRNYFQDLDRNGRGN